MKYHHHEKRLSTQVRFKRQVNNLFSQFKECGNLFEQACSELLVVPTREFAPDSVASRVFKIEEVGHLQYQQYKVEVLESMKNRRTSH